jgi:hypothetical protein
MSDELGSNRIALAHPGRTAGVIALVAALLLAGLLLLERSGSSPVQPLRTISAGQSAPAIASAPAGQGASAKPAVLHTTLNGATISGGGASQITDSSGGPAETICTQFTGGTASTLSTVSYDTKSGTITKVTVPGTFFYWVKVQVSTPGTQSFTVTQSTTYAPTSGTPYFGLQSGGSAYDGSCNPLSTTITGGGASQTVSFQAATAGTYIVGLHFGTHNIIGSSPASDTSGFSYNYTFATTGSSGSTQGLMLTHV